MLRIPLRFPLKRRFPVQLAAGFAMSLLLFTPTTRAADETLHYVVKWPSGLSLGEASLRSNMEGFSLNIDASLPAYPITDEFRSRATPAFCSLEFEKKSLHGKRAAAEKSTFDASSALMTRTTKNGGKSEIPVEACSKDALTFLFFLRREMSQGKVPEPRTVYFGAAYQVKLTYNGAETLKYGAQQEVTDKVSGTVKGPASENRFEIWFARDPVRTPLRIRVPFSLGAFSMELVR